MKFNFRLGLILGTKIYIDFTRGDFGESMEKLKKELVQEIGITDSSMLNNMKIESSNFKKQFQNNSTMGNIEKMTKEQVKEWLINSNIDKSIAKEISDFDGEMMAELKLIQDKAPEYFYQNISQSNKIKLSEVVKFSQKLRNFN